MMKISTKGRYGLRVMMDLAIRSSDHYISLRDISAQQNITVRYLEVVVASLLKARLVMSFRGKEGGYKLTRHPSEYNVLEIIECLEGSLVPVSCMTTASNQCPLAPKCITLPLWRGYYEVTRQYFSCITLQQLIDNTKEIVNCAELTENDHD